MSKDSKQYIIELDGVLYRLSGNQLEQMDDLKNLNGDAWYITDMQTAISRTMTVDAAISYVDVIVRKKLQESGEFDSSVTILDHWKKRKDKSTTEIFFTALPTKLASHYSDLSKTSEDNLLVFPLYKVLFNILKSFKLLEPIAVVFQHNRFADLVIGTKSKVHYANRCVGFDMSQDQIAALWDSVRSDIQTVENENKIKVKKIILLNWIDSGKLPDWSSDEQCEYFVYEDENITSNGDIHHISFTSAIKKLSGIHSTSRPLEKLFYYSRQVIPNLNIALFTVLIFFGCVFFYFTQKSGELENRINQTKKKIAQIKIGSLGEVDQEKFKTTLKFVKDLSLYRKAPPFKMIINDISRAVSSGMTLDILKVDYETGKIKIRVFGKVKAPFKTAYKGYRDFLIYLKQRGYTVSESRFNTEISSSKFTTSFTKGVK